MSAHNLSFTDTRGLHSFFTMLLIALAFLAFAPSFVSANTLPAGVLERQTCGDFSVDIQAYGAGMMHNTNPIEISNRRVSHIGATENCAVVQWDSTTPAATQVIFTELVNEPVTVRIEEPNFGYPYATVQNNAGIANHTAILTELEAGKAYAYRLVTRSHPSALPTISDPQVLIAGPAVVTTPIVVNPVVVTPKPTFDAEKFPVVPTQIENKEEQTTTEDTTNVVPSALTAAEDAFGVNSREGSIWPKITGFFVRLVPNGERFSLHSSIGLFEKDRYIVPAIFLLVVLFLIQQLVLPAFNVSLKNPLLYWLVGSVVLAVLSSVFMLYYITLLAIALFLGILAWYLLQNISEDTNAPTQPKLLDTVKTEKKKITK